MKKFYGIVLKCYPLTDIGSEEPMFTVRKYSSLSAMLDASAGICGEHIMFDAVGSAAFSKKAKELKRLMAE